ncbi:MAG: LysR family transcriptional regulator [Thalassovita sp.]
MDWSDLKLFLLFVRSGSTRAAGEALGISHSTVARKLDAMSAMVGAPLYQRRGGKIDLSRVGQEVLATASTIEDEIVTLDRRTFGTSQEISGALTLSMGDVLAVPPVLEILDAFRLAHPGIDLRLITSASLTDLDRRDADLALRFGQSPDDHLVGRKLTETARAIYISKGQFDAAQRTSPTPPLGWISFSPRGASETWKKSTPFSKRPTVMRVSDMRTQQMACRAGVGLALLPCVLCDPDPCLVRITEPEFVPRQDLWLLRHAELRNNTRVRVLSDHLVRSLPQLLDVFRGNTRETQALPSASLNN